MSDVAFFSMWHLLGNRVSNTKKFEVSCQAEIPKNKYKKKTSIPKTQIRGRERSEGEKDSDQKERKTQAAATQANPSHDDPGVRAPGLGRAGPGFAWVAHSALKPPTPIFDLDLLSLSVFFFFSWVLL